MTLPSFFDLYDEQDGWIYDRHVAGWFIPDAFSIHNLGGIPHARFKLDRGVTIIRSNNREWSTRVLEMFEALILNSESQWFSQNDRATIQKAAHNARGEYLEPMGHPLRGGEAFIPTWGEGYVGSFEVHGAGLAGHARLEYDFDPDRMMLANTMQPGFAFFVGLLGTTIMSARDVLRGNLTIGTALDISEVVTDICLEIYQRHHEDLYWKHDEVPGVDWVDVALGNPEGLEMKLGHAPSDDEWNEFVERTEEWAAGAALDPAFDRDVVRQKILDLVNERRQLLVRHRAGRSVYLASMKPEKYGDIATPLFGSGPMSYARRLAEDASHPIFEIDSKPSHPALSFEVVTEDILMVPRQNLENSVVVNLFNVTMKLLTDSDITMVDDQTEAIFERRGAGPLGLDDLTPFEQRWANLALNLAWRGLPTVPRIVLIDNPELDTAGPDRRRLAEGFEKLSTLSATKFVLNTESRAFWGFAPVSHEYELRIENGEATAIDSSTDS